MELQQVRAWTREAGAIALGYYNTVEARRKPDRSYVTAADEEIEQLLRQRIKAAYPDHGIVGEEQGQHNVNAEYLWAIDPIDGTGAFVSGLPIWGISIGLLRHGRPILGCFHMPVMDEWYEADVTGPALFNGQPTEVMRDGLLDSESWICTPSNIHRRYTIDYPGKVRSLGSMAAYVSYVARGTAAGALVGQPKLWDVAAGLVVLERAGGEARLLRSRAPLDVRSMLSGRSAPEPVVVGSPEAVELLLDRIRLRERRH
jgi:myo-inositol-1(or 4)-monophosphatase